ncbi:sigma 54-interacting transcriptional regulator [Oscillospiraceae bacterium MB08-C2-2]|nr:sigma 54-interacting transcriptional regulator [Oscillospiraceae bacterium MB08-C2-2]
MRLGDIAHLAGAVADATSGILGADVVIIDDQLGRINSTYPQCKAQMAGDTQSISADVVTQGRTICVRYRETYPACRACPNKEDCPLCSFIGVPIFADRQVMGALCLVITEPESIIYSNRVAVVAYLEKMAILLGQSLEEHRESGSLRLLYREQEQLLDTVEEALVTTDEKGQVEYYNHAFAKVLGLSESGLGTSVFKLIPHSVVSRFLSRPSWPIANKIISFEAPGAAFYGTISGLRRSSPNPGFMFILKSLSPASDPFSRLMGGGSTAAFDQTWWKPTDPSGVIESAKRLAITEETILMVGEESRRRDLLAGAIHNFSNRAQGYFVTVDCTMLSPLALEEELFGKTEGVLGKLRLAHKGTLYFREIGEMPLYLQERLAEFFRTSLVRGSSGMGGETDFRLLVSTSENLRELCAEGFFAEKLYYRISQNVLTLPSVWEDKQQLAAVIKAAFSTYTRLYSKEELEVEPQAIELLSQREWSGGLREIKRIVDWLVWKCRSVVTAEEVMALPVPHVSIQTREEFEREQLEYLLGQNYTKNEIARKMNIGRATLYRKINRYNLRTDDTQGKASKP